MEVTFGSSSRSSSNCCQSDSGAWNWNFLVRFSLRSTAPLALTAVVGCAAEPQVDAAQYRAAYKEQVFSQCDSYGYLRGTREFSDCVMRVDLQNRSNDAALGNAILQEGMRRQNEALPPCSSLGPGMAGYERAAGRCR